MTHNRDALAGHLAARVSPLPLGVDVDPESKEVNLWRPWSLKILAADEVVHWLRMSL
jgi:hypothetical protein